MNEQEILKKLDTLGTVRQRGILHQLIGWHQEACKQGQAEGFAFFRALDTLLDCEINAINTPEPAEDK